MLRLGTTVVAGGVLYPAGTPATRDLLDLIDGRHWVGDPADPSDPPGCVEERDTLAAQVEALTIERDAAVARAEAAEAALAEVSQPAIRLAKPAAKPRTTRRKTGD